jgi:hypothetical protein
MTTLCFASKSLVFLRGRERENKYIESQRKFIDLKKTKLFRFRWIWVEEKKFRGSLQFPPSLLWGVGGGGGGDFVDTVLALERGELKLIL